MSWSKGTPLPPLTTQRPTAQVLLRALPNRYPYRRLNKQTASRSPMKRRRSVPFACCRFRASRKARSMNRQSAISRGSTARKAPPPMRRCPIWCGPPVWAGATSRIAPDWSSAMPGSSGGNSALSPPPMGRGTRKCLARRPKQHSRTREVNVSGSAWVRRSIGVSL